MKVANIGGAFMQGFELKNDRKLTSLCLKFDSGQQLESEETTSVRIDFIARADQVIESVDIEYWGSSQYRRKLYIQLNYTMTVKVGIATEIRCPFNRECFLSDISNNLPCSLFVNDRQIPPQQTSRVRSIAGRVKTWQTVDMRNGLFDSENDDSVLVVLEEGSSGEFNVIIKRDRPITQREPYSLYLIESDVKFTQFSILCDLCGNVDGSSNETCVYQTMHAMTTKPMVVAVAMGTETGLLKMSNFLIKN